LTPIKPVWLCQPDERRLRERDYNRLEAFRAVYQESAR
jgi:hypothetical protein